MSDSGVEVRLFDSQWVNIVNYDKCFAGYTVEDAVAKAVRMAERYMANNVKDNEWPTDSAREMIAAIPAQSLQAIKAGVIGWCANEFMSTYYHDNYDAALIAEVANEMKEKYKGQ